MGLNQYGGMKWTSKHNEYCATQTVQSYNTAAHTQGGVQ